MYLYAIIISKSAVLEVRMEQTFQKRGYLLEDFRLFHMRDIPKERIEYHYHEFYKLLIVLSGISDFLDQILLDETQYQRSDDYDQNASQKGAGLQICHEITVIFS